MNWTHYLCLIIGCVFGLFLAGILGSRHRPNPTPPPTHLQIYPPPDPEP